MCFQEPYNNGQGRDRSLEAKTNPYEAKKARLNSAEPSDPYGLFLYQTMAAMAGKAGQVHPATLAAYSNYAQAIKVTLESWKQRGERAMIM